jgi:anti-anti-sigma factor
MDSFHVSCLDCVVESGVHVLSITRASLLDEDATQLRRDAAAVLPPGAPSRVVLDLARVDAMSSAGVGALVGLLKRIREQGGQLVLCGLSPRVAYVLKMCRLIDEDAGRAIFVTTRDQESALARLAAS